MKDKPKKIPLKKVVRLNCPACGELEIKLYPYSSFTFQGGDVPNCIKCINKANAKALVKAR